MDLKQIVKFKLKDGLILVIFGGALVRYENTGRRRGESKYNHFFVQAVGFPDDADTKNTLSDLTRSGGLNKRILEILHAQHMDLKNNKLVSDILIDRVKKVIAKKTKSIPSDSQFKIKPEIFWKMGDSPIPSKTEDAMTIISDEHTVKDFLKRSDFLHPGAECL